MNRQTMVGVLRDAGIEVKDGTIPPSTLGLPDSVRVRLLVDHEGLFRVYCAVNLPSSLPISGIKGALKKSGDEALLLLDRGRERLMALHMTSEGADTQLELGEAEVARLLPHVRLGEGEDPFEVSERVRDLILHPEEEREAFQNRGLFSDDYLKYRLTDSIQYPEWEEDISQSYKDLRDLYDSKKGHLDGLNEAQTESEFLDEAIKILGHAFVKQTSTVEGSRPDYALFGDEEKKNAAFGFKEDLEKFYAPSLAVAEGKYWGRNLDIYTKKDDKDNEATARHKSSPEMQISRYLQETGLPWGILTNGEEWRLYNGGAVGKTKRYYAVDFVRALESEEEFRRFYLFFRREAFVPRGAEGKSFLDRVLTGSEDYAVRVGKELKRVVFERLFARVAKGFLEYHGKELKLTVDEEALKKTYRGTLALLYRLLFLLYAEARDLLPVGDRLGYGVHSITRLKRDIAVRIDEGEKFSEKSYVIWEQLDSLFRIVDGGSPDLNVPPYNGGLFKDAGSHEFLGTRRISDRYLAPALDDLSRQAVEDGKRRFVDYGFIGVRELGSVYEGLLEFSLKVADADLVVVKEKGKEVYVPKGSQKKKKVFGEVKKGDPYLVNDKKERKATGSYYTPRYIVDYIVENTLGPLVEERRVALEERLAEIGKLKDELRRSRKSEEYITDEARKKEALKTLLDVKVLDPAMGSGHFLVAAVDYLTDEFTRTIDELGAEPVVEELAELRTEIQAGLEAYGAQATNEQLSDANLLKRMVLKRCVYGVDMNEMAVELAKLSLWLDAFTVGAPLSFLDHHLKHGNSLIGSSVREVRKEVEKTGSLFGNQFTATLIQGTELMQHVGEIPDATVGEVRESIASYGMADEVLSPYKRMLDIWTSQHFGNKGAENFLSETSATGAVDDLTKGNYDHFTGGARKIIDTATDLSESKLFFHWELEFPEVFYEGSREQEYPGFDAVVGNPPYVSAPAMVREAPNLRSYLTNTEDLLTMKWDLYCAFMALGWRLTARSGRLGAIIPNQFMYQDYAVPIRSLFAREAQISTLVDLGNTEVFEDVSVMTCILSVEKGSGVDNQVRATITEERHINTLQTVPYYPVPQRLFLELPSNIYRLALDEFAYSLVQRLLRASYTLGALCYGSVGVVPHSEKLNKPKETFIFDRKVNDKCQRYIEGKNADRYLIKWDGSWLEYDYDVVRRPSLPELLETEKIAIRIVAGKTGLRAVYDGDGFYTDHSFVLFALKKQLVDIKRRNLHLKPQDVDLSSNYDLFALLALINSKLLGWLFLFYLSSDLNIGPDDARRLPIRAISFDTHPQERESAVEEASRLYEDRNYPAVVQWAEQEVSWALKIGHTSGGRNDTVHDLLAHLAEQMTAMHKEHAEIEQTWQEWAETILPSNHKLTKTFLEQGWVEIGLESGWEGVKSEFQARNAIPGGKDLQRLRKETEEALSELRPLYERIRKTDELIDQIVYRLYGLTEEEIAVVEASAAGA